MAYEVISSEKVYTGKVFNIEKDEITLPDGRTTFRETVRHNGASAMVAVDDEGRTFDLSPDPMLPRLREQLAGVTPGDPDSLGDQLKLILSNPTLFGSDLYQAGPGEKIEGMVREQLAGPGAVRETLKRWLSSSGHRS